MTSIRTLLLAALMSSATYSIAQQLVSHVPDTLFFHINSADAEVSADELPEVCYTQALPTDRYYESVQDFEVKLEYPEYAPLTPKEVKDAKKHKESIATEITPSLYLGCYRRQQQLDVTFCPIVKRHGRYMRLTSCRIAVYAKNDSRNKSRAQLGDAPADRYAEHSVLSKGKWVKLSVTNEGMYEITASQAKQWGFDDISRVKLYGYGGRIQPEVLNYSTGEFIDDLCEVPLYRKSSSVLFYANGVVRWKYNYDSKKYEHTDNYYSRTGYYFLTEGDAPAEMQEFTFDVETSEQGTQTSIVPYYALYDGNAEMWYDGGRRLFDSHNFATGQQHAFRLDSPGFVGTEGSLLEVSMSASSALQKTIFTIRMNGESCGNMSVAKFSDNESAKVGTSRFTPTLLATNNNVSITSSNTNNARLDYMRLTYQRTLDGTATPYSFQTGQPMPVQLTIDKADAGTQVWALMDNGKVMRVSGQLVGSTYTTAAVANNVRLALVNVSRSYASPTYVGEVANQDLHADADIDYVIVVPSSGKLIEQAIRLARLHEQHDGLRIKIARAEEIYNEFSSGTPDATAIRRYMKMLYDRATDMQNAPKYLLLFGNSLADNRLLTPKNKTKRAEDLLLCFEKDNLDSSVGTLHSYCSDDYFGFLDDGEGANILLDKLDIAIGRMCCTEPEEARILVDKVETYLSNKTAGAWKNDILMMGDYGDKNEHMKDAERVTAAITAVDNRLTIRKVYPDSYIWTNSATGHSFPGATRRINDILTNGVTLVNYSGHGAPNQLSHASIVNTQMLTQISSDRLPVWLLASCDIFPIDSEEDNMGRTCMLKPHGGCIAFINATRAVYATYNNPLNCSVSKFLFARNEEGERYTLGQALTQAKLEMISKRQDVTMNKLKYVLVGDPALQLASPNGRVVLDAINDTPVSPEDFTTLRAGSVVTISGHIENEENVHTTNYKGKLNLRIYDRQKSVTCKNNAGDDVDNYVYNVREDCVFSNTVNVEGGVFTATIAIPIDISYSNDAARFTFYAVDENNRNECSGIYENICLNGTDPAVMEDSTPPSVLLYFNNEEFPDGGAIAQNAVLEARISDNYGINASGNALGHDMSLIIDGDVAHATKVNDFFEYDFGTHLSGHLSYPLTGLSYGKHTAALRVWDVNNNNTLATISFLVSSNPPAEGIFNVVCSQTPTGSQTQLVATLPADHEGGELIYYIYSTTGRLIWEY
ncbi:MAG: type IX secretion system sortase PorU, partial [Bacteroidaceae bacterium]|nr:type IX secretion system sortase PorU [Bacteroidaceae bacterium]